MNGKQMKKGTLRFLLICNVILLIVIAVFGVSSSLRTSTESRQTAELLESRGVTITGDVYKALLEEKTAYTIRTDTEAWDTFSTALLNGSAEATAQSGGSIVWIGETGSLTWSSDSTVVGTVDLSVFGSVSSAEAIERRITSLLKEGGVDLGQTDIQCTENDDSTVVRVQQGVNGKNLNGCELTFTVDSDGQALVNGQWCLAEPEEVVLGGLDDSTPADILLALTNQYSAVTQVTAVSQVYVLSNKSGGRFTALPCWKLTTDQGEYIINPLTGEEASTTDSTQTDSIIDSNPDSSSDTITDYTDGVTIDSDTITDSFGTTDDDTTDDTGTDSTWDSAQGTDKTDPELPDENGVYG